MGDLLKEGKPLGMRVEDWTLREHWEAGKDPEVSLELVRKDGRSFMFIFTRAQFKSLFGAMQAHKAQIDMNEGNPPQGAG